jgi:hypothetical protein
MVVHDVDFVHIYSSMILVLSYLRIVHMYVQEYVCLYLV